ncbi:lysozyme inhibitor LprI family protein [Roseibium sp.]|uniref:lysozyme inhibitor LprI family protein n=1 Tax=Roseibium sp. TaxID=1936156 RepID=UPI003A98487A
MAVIRQLALAIGVSLLLAGSGNALDQSAADAIDCGYPLNQMEMTYCAEQSWQAADTELNAAYKAAMTRMREMDEYLDGRLKGAADSLRDAQRAWIPYRDKACEAYGFQARGGTMEPMLIYGCLATLTKKRTDELNELAEGLGN